MKKRYVRGHRRTGRLGKSLFAAALLLVCAGIVYAAYTLSKNDHDYYTKMFAEAERISKLREAWAKVHCSRVWYEHGQGIYHCDDGNVYKLFDMPTGE